MTINLVEKHEKEIVTKFTKESLINGATNSSYSWDGARTIQVYTPISQELNTYDRSNPQITQSRFGILTDMQDDIQRMTCDQEDAFNIALDKAIGSDQNYIKAAARMMKLQFAEQNVPKRDRHAFGEWAKHAGLVKTVDTPTETNIVKMLSDALIAMDNELVPAENRIIYISATNYGILRLSKQFIECDPTAQKSLEKGTVGSFMGNTVRKVPDTYLPVGVQFMITYKGSVLAPVKLKTMRILEEHPDIDGQALQGHHYYGAFVLKTRKNGVYVGVTSDGRAADPTVAIASHSATVTGASGAAIYYTLDGSDPRDKDNPERKVYSAAVTTKKGETIRAYQEVDGLLPSNIVEKTD